MIGSKKAPIFKCYECNQSLRRDNFDHTVLERITWHANAKRNRNVGPAKTLLFASYSSYCFSRRSSFSVIFRHFPVPAYSNIKTFAFKINNHRKKKRLGDEKRDFLMWISAHVAVSFFLYPRAHPNTPNTWHITWIKVTHELLLKLRWAMALLG